MDQFRYKFWSSHVHFIFYVSVAWCSAFNILHRCVQVCVSDKHTWRWHHGCTYTCMWFCVCSGTASTSVTNFTAAPATLNLIYCHKVSNNHSFLHPLFSSASFLPVCLALFTSVTKIHWKFTKNVGQSSGAKSVSDGLKCELHWLHTARMANCRKHTAKRTFTPCNKHTHLHTQSQLSTQDYIYLEGWTLL